MCYLFFIFLHISIGCQLSAHFPVISLELVPERSSLIPTLQLLGSLASASILMIDSHFSEHVTVFVQWQIHPVSFSRVSELGKYKRAEQ